MIEDRDIGVEYGRVSAYKLQKFNKETRKIEGVFLPQIEIIEYDPASGDEISAVFRCLSKGDDLVECEFELEAIVYAISVRDNKGEAEDGGEIYENNYMD